MNSNSCDQPTQVRKIKPTRRSVSGVIPFRDAGGIPYESLLERDFLKRMRFASGVSAVIPQPVEIEFAGANGRVHTYTPDYLVYYRLGFRHYSEHLKPMLVEVKPAHLWREKWREWSFKWKTARRYAADRGWQFCIYDESRIRGQALQNIIHLERYERMVFDPEDIDLVVNTLREMEIAPVHYLLARHFNGIYRSTGISLLWHLVATRRLDCDIREPLNEDLELWVAAL